MKSTKHTKTHLHVHVTVDSFPDITPKGWKTTTIMLQRSGRFQKDKMLTKHFLLDNTINFIQYILTQVSMLPLTNIVRVKIEQETNFPDIIQKPQYLEIHAEVAEINNLPFNWVFSCNELRQDMVFINKRFYDGNIIDCMDSVNMDLKTIDQPYDYRAELIIYDSNPSIDKWWA